MNNRNNKKRQNVLDKYIQKNGSLDYINSVSVSKLSIGLFKDFAYGNITQEDISKYQKFFLNSEVLQNLLMAATLKQREAEIHCFAMEAYFTKNPTQNTNPTALELHKRDYGVYLFFNIIANAIVAVQHNGDIRILYALQNNLQRCKNYFKFIV